jgi:hypothetical protein
MSVVGDHNRNWFKIHFLSFMNHSCNIENIYELKYGCLSLGSEETDPEARCKSEIIPLRGLYRGVGEGGSRTSRAAEPGKDLWRMVSIPCYRVTDQGSRKTQVFIPSGPPAIG